VNELGTAFFQNNLNTNGLKTRFYQTTLVIGKKENLNRV